MTTDLTLAPTAAAPARAESRYHSLDAVRGFALLLGVVFHAAESFTHEAVNYWAIGDRSPSVFLELFRHGCHSFRLELFFLIAGFFAHLLWQKRGVGGFVRNRAGRIVVPLVVGWAILYPLLVFIWLTGAAKSGRWEAIGVPGEYRSLAPWQLTLGFFVGLEFLRKFDLTHLWFLYQLLVLYGAALAARSIVLRLGSRGERVMARLDQLFRKAMTSRFRVGWFVAASFPALYVQHGWSVDTPKESLIPEVPASLLFSLFFGVGWALHRQRDLVGSCGRHWQWYLALGVLLVAPSGSVLWFCHGAGLFEGYGVWIRLVYYLIYGVMMWSFVFGFLGLFLHFRRTESPGWRYVADASYWIYLVHLPLVVGLQVWVADWPYSWMVKFPWVNLVVLAVSFLSYHYLVRGTFIGRQLNGRRYPLRSGG